MSSGQTIVDYASLEQAIQDWLARSDITDDNYLPEIIQAGQDRICTGFMDDKGYYFAGLRIRQMETRFPGGVVSGITVTAPGSGYADTDTVAFAAAPTGGVTATGTLEVSNGAVTGVNVTKPGNGYTTAPALTITTSTGTGATLTSTISASSVTGPGGNIAVPSDYLDLKYMVLMYGSNYTSRPERKNAEWIYANYAERRANSVPAFVARDGDVFIFGPYPDQQYSIGGLYYARPAPLSSTNTTNWMTNDYPTLLFAACMAEAAQFIQDSNQVSFWTNRYQLLARAIQAGDTKEQVSGSPLRMSAQ